MTNEITRRAGSDLLDGNTAAEADALVSTFMSAMEHNGLRKMLPVAPTADERRLLQERLRMLTVQLRPQVQSERDKVKEAIGAVFAGFPSLITLDNDAKRKMVAAYVLHLQELPLFAVLVAIDAVRTGRVKGPSPEFPPTSVRIFLEAENKLHQMREDEARTRMVLEVREFSGPPVSDEVRERGSKMLRELADKLRLETAAREVAEAGLRSERTAKVSRANNDSMMLREYRRRGVEPVYDGAGSVISPWLVDNVGAAKIEMNQAQARARDADRDRRRDEE